MEPVSDKKNMDDTLPCEEILRENLKSKRKRPSTAYTEPKCKVCKKAFKDKGSLTKHEAIHNPEDPFHCDLCDYKCKTLQYLRRHERRAHGTPTSHKCDVCGKMFHFHSNLLNHMRVHTGERPYSCDVCGKTFSAKFCLDMHHLIHSNEKPYQCKYCDYACRDSSTLRRHHERHMGLTKWYQCDNCDKKYTNKSKLRAHASEVHLNIDVKKFKCNLCEKRFKCATNLRTHVRVVHDKVVPFKCHVCGKRTSNKNNLSTHMLIHTEDRPHECTFKACKKRFKDKHALKRHIVVHMPEKQFACELCGKRYSRKTRLNTHVRQHDQKKAMLCDHCGLAFFSKASLGRHIHTHMGKPLKNVKPHKKFEPPRRITRARTRAIVKQNYNELDVIDESSEQYGVQKPSNDVSEMETGVQPSVEVKTEPVDPDDLIPDAEIDLFEIEKHEVFAGFNLNGDLEGANDTDYSDAVLSEDIARSRREKTGDPEDLLDQLFARNCSRVMDKDNLNDDANQLLDLKGEDSTRQNNKTDRSEMNGDIVLERDKNISKKENNMLEIDDNIVTMINKTMLEKNSDSIIERDDDIISKTNELSEREENIALEEDDTVLERDGGICEAGGSEKDSNSFTRKDKKIKFNSHQCYICFKLYETKQTLLDHCKMHFDDCNETTLKKCPLCKFVTKGNIRRHIKVIHDIELGKLPFTHINDKIINGNKSRYYYKLNNRNIDELEIVPSVKILNKRACTEIDKRNRSGADKSVCKTRLVKNGNEWIVKRSKLDLREYMLPRFSEQVIAKYNISGVTHYDRLKFMYALAKKRNIKMLFPCDICEKVCLTLSALKLHNRRHDANPKPFKPKTWRHKTGENMEKSVITEKPVYPEKLSVTSVSIGDSGLIGKSVVTEKSAVTEKSRSEKPVPGNRFAAPKPIVNKHRCDPKLIEFYKKNVKGSDVEFWQFLKIYNKIDRDNVKDFDELKS